MIKYISIKELGYEPYYVKIHGGHDMSGIQIALGVVLMIVSVIIIILVLMQESKAELSGAISGGAADSFFGKNKGRTSEARLRRLTVIFGSVFGVLTLVSSLLLLFFSSK